MDVKPIEWAFDTETYKGKAILLTIAGPNSIKQFLPFPKSFRRIFEWLVSFAEKYTVYNMDFDARALIKFLPRKVWITLYRDEQAQWEGFRLNYRPGKYFSASRGEESFTLFDCAIFFQKSLKAAAEEVLKDERKGEIPETWYADMASALRDPVRKHKVVAYALQDAEVCRRLWAFLSEQFLGIGLPPKALERPLSPGSLAAEYFKERLQFDIPPWANWLARRAYAGGRIEVYQRGKFSRCYVYDIRSAYPWALSNLPDPRELEVATCDGMRPDAVYSVLHCVLRIPEMVVCPPIPAWGDKTRIFPTGYFSTWITYPEYLYSKRRGWIRDVFSACHLIGKKKTWLTDIPSLYQMRKDRPELSLALKLILNSLYGKLGEVSEGWAESQSIEGGTRRIGGRFVRKIKRFSGHTNFFVAAYVTALCRLRLQEVIDKIGAENVVMSATDGVLTKKPLPSKWTGDGLGGWALTAKNVEAVVVGNGVYSLKYDGEWHDKMRGYRLTEPLVEVLDKAGTRIQTKSRMAYTLGDWATKKDIELNDIVELPRTLNVNFDKKRLWPKQWKHGRDVLRGRMSSAAPVLLEDIKEKEHAAE